MVQLKGKGSRRKSDWCAICMEEYEFISIGEITREECCLKKIANCDFAEQCIHCEQRRKWEVNVKAGRVGRAQ